MSLLTDTSIAQREFAPAFYYILQKEKKILCKNLIKRGGQNHRRADVKILYKKRKDVHRRRAKHEKQK